VELRSHPDRFGRIDVWIGRLNATHLKRREVDLTLLSDEESTVLVSWIGYVVDEDGRKHGPLKYQPLLSWYTPSGLVGMRTPL
jgi:hypothetical protein